MLFCLTYTYTIAHVQAVVKCFFKLFCTIFRIAFKHSSNVSSFCAAALSAVVANAHTVFLQLRKCSNSFFVVRKFSCVLHILALMLVNLYILYSTSMHVCKEKVIVRKQALSIYFVSACFY